ncbi:MAG TPA: Chromate resistance protein ChrB [Candidatus Limnocylindria bacterium]|nr:Chromate resistance protein ChrB [Candidatus Limnocylindria bacterium]
MVTRSSNQWVFLVYRLPREPSAPRIALWRALRRLGALLVSDGLFALPHTPRNREHLQWLAATIREEQGTAAVWIAQPDSAATHREYVEMISAAVAAEYETVRREAAETGDDEGERKRALGRLRRQLRRIGSRDYFEVSSGRAAHEAVEGLANVEVTQ